MHREVVRRQAHVRNVRPEKVIAARKRKKRTKKRTKKKRKKKEKTKKRRTKKKRTKKKRTSATTGVEWVRVKVL